MEEFVELQNEEIEVLQSIYEGDESFKQISQTSFQYKYGEESDKSFIIEISWPETYPSVIPTVSLDVFHNNFLPDDFKNEIKEKIIEQANDLIDSAMTYSLFDWLKENCNDYLSRIPDILESKRSKDVVNGDVVTATNGDINIVTKVKKEKKEQLTKAQKRKITQRTNHKGERERGWNWVDVIKHLSQTGGQKT